MSGNQKEMWLNKGIPGYGLDDFGQTCRSYSFCGGRTGNFGADRNARVPTYIGFLPGSIAKAREPEETVTDMGNVLVGHHTYLSTAGTTLAPDVTLLLMSPYRAELCRISSKERGDENSSVAELPKGRMELNGPPPPHTRTGQNVLVVVDVARDFRDEEPDCRDYTNLLVAFRILHLGRGMFHAHVASQSRGTRADNPARPSSDKRASPSTSASTSSVIEIE
ncbi:hypothetical protein GLOTRDRAFT_94563 [Gloeophyllum trabeum ATCC 11539]|uniref:Uncharacterized protein n=1 Tax=Gloeophyllum trabeum (strain ATCC 11539 / FP-39264 / Madison 617) TaxID=670483 RepID=S7RN91_GLOTA|nr:uncharacterized protein GLOTRDRAFT_94563 [Gloeophyllum trabeum ATCC 11539]EPQ54229.1 hypothetical protein GLOTRDRAFT_94563 [Gloeophyllum trabeum ATCC 11539]